MKCIMCGGEKRFEVDYFDEHQYSRLNIYCDLENHKKYIPCHFCKEKGKISIFYLMGYWMICFKIEIYSTISEIKNFVDWIFEKGIYNRNDL